MLQGLIMPALASPSAPKKLEGMLFSDFTITKENGDPVGDNLHLGNRVRLNMNWAAPKEYDYNLNEGDYFELELSSLLTVPLFPGNIDFALRDENNNIIANGHIDPKSPGGGTVRITFTKAVEGKAEVKGNLYIIAGFVDTDENIGNTEIFTIAYGAEVYDFPPISIQPKPVDSVVDEAIRKWAGVVRVQQEDGTTISVPDRARWTIRVNAQEKPMTNIVLKDRFTQPEGASVPMVLFEDKFQLERVLYKLNAQGEVESFDARFETLTIDKNDPRLAIDPDGQGFTFNLGDAQQVKDITNDPKYDAFKDRYITYLLRYESTYEPGLRLKNRVEGSFNPGPPVIKESSYYAQEAGGGGDATQANFLAQKRWSNGVPADYTKIRLTLLRDGVAFDAPDHVVTEVNQTTFNYTWSQLPVTNPVTNEKYRYSVEEAGVVDGTITIDGRVYAVNQEGNVITNTYQVPTIEVVATKTWDGGPSADHTAVALILSQQITGGTAEVVADPAPAVTGSAPAFTYTWSNLPATDLAGSAYTYTVSEAAVTAGERVVNGNTYAVNQAGNDITNTYLDPEKALINLALKKELSGDTLKAGAFTFQLFGENPSAPALETKTNAADGSVTFSLQFDLAGKYIVHVKEIAGAIDGMTYDSSVYKLTYEVKLAAGNKLQAELTEVRRNDAVIDKAAPIVFKNELVTPSPTPTATPTATPTTTPTTPPVSEPPTPTYPTITVPLSVKKELKNGTLKAGAFTFQLKDKSGKVLSEVTNAADGSVVFPDRTFSKEVSNYLYTINEVKGADSRMTYDTTVYTVKVTTRAVGGALQATVDIEKNGVPFAGKMLFTNKLPAPPTGDYTMQTLLLLLGASLVMLSAAYVVKSWRGKKADTK